MIPKHAKDQNLIEVDVTANLQQTKSFTSNIILYLITIILNNTQSKRWQMGTQVAFAHLM